MLNDKLYNRQRSDMSHLHNKLNPYRSSGVSPRRSPEAPTERPASTPLSDGKEYGHRLLDLVNTWHEDTRRMLREELATYTMNFKLDTPPAPLKEERSGANPEVLQSILTEIRTLTPQCNCGAVDRVAIAQEELAEIVRGHLLVERAASVNSRRDESAAPSESMQGTNLQPLLAELTAAFGEMQQALKGSAALVEEVRQKPERESRRNSERASPLLNAELDMEILMQELQQIKDILSHKSSCGSETLLAAEMQLLKENLYDVQQKSEKDSQAILNAMDKFADVMSATATTQQDESMAAAARQNQRVLDAVNHLAELVGIDHRKAQEDASAVRQSVDLLEVEMKLIKESMATSVRQSNQELIERLRILEDSMTASHQEAEQKSAARLEMAHGSQTEQIERKAELHSHAVGDLKEEVLILKDQIAKCHEKLEKAPKQLALAEVVRKTFHQLTKEFHEECTQLYMKPSFQVNFPETLSQDLGEIKEALAEQRRGGEETKANSIVELGRLEQEVQRTEEGVQGLESVVKGQLVPELQHLQEIFAMLEGNVLSTMRKQLDKATAAFSSTTAHFTSEVKKGLENTLEASKVRAAQEEAAESSDDQDHVPSNGHRLIEFLFIFLSIVEFAMHLTNAFLELNNTDRFILALAAAIGPCLLNLVVILVFVSYLKHELQRWMSSNSSHSTRLLAFSVLRPDALRFFGLLVPQLHSSCGAWEQRYWEEILQSKNQHLQQECDELRLALHSREESHSTRTTREARTAAHSDGWKDTEEIRPPAVPIHSEAVHGALSPGGDADGELLQPSGVRKVYKWKQQNASHGRGSLGRPVNLRHLPHGCLLCGLSPDAERKTVSMYRKFMCLLSLASALYNDAPKVVLSIWLLSFNDSSESVILRVAIIVISSMYALWALLNALITQIEETCGWRQSSHTGPQLQAGVENAVVEASAESLTVSWSCPAGLSAKARPKDFVCTVQPLGQSESSMLRRISVEDEELRCTFAALQADTAYVVKLAASQKGVLLGRPIRISCRTLPLPLAAEAESLSLRSCGSNWAEIAWSGAGPTEQLLELRQHGVAGSLLRRELAGPEPVHCIWGLRPNTEYEVGLKLPSEKIEKEASLKLSFVTALEEDEPYMNVLSSFTTLLKDLGSVKEMVSSLDAAAASAELTRQLGGLQDRWASLQVSCLTEQIQKLMDSNQQLKSDLSNEMKPVFSELRRIEEALIAM